MLSSMFEPTTTFPVWTAAASAAVALAGLWLIFTRSRRRVGDEPRCARCAYILIGLDADPCPECGTIIDRRALAHGRPRRRGFRIIGGLALLAVAFALSRSPVQRWWQSNYWYPLRPAYLVMKDLKEGTGRPPPAKHPLQESWGHGWVSEQVDLARVALDELLRRDRLGKLPPRYRREIDEIALSGMTVPFTTPVQYHLNEELVRRVIAQKLTPQQQANFYRSAVRLSLTARPVVIKGDEVPVRVRYQTAPLSRGWEVLTSVKSVRIDGGDAPPWPESTVQPWIKHKYLCGGWDIHDDRRITCAGAGRHQLEVEVQIDFHPSGRQGPPFHSEMRKLATSFEVVTLTPDQLITLVDDPKVAAAIQGSITCQQLIYNLWGPKSVSGTLEARQTPVSYAFEVFARFEGRDWPIGRVAHAAGAPIENLHVDSDYANHPMPQPPPKVDLVLRSDSAAARTTLELYEIWAGEIILKDVAIRTAK